MTTARLHRAGSFGASLSDVAPTRRASRTRRRWRDSSNVPFPLPRVRPLQPTSRAAVHGPTRSPVPICRADSRYSRPRLEVSRPRGVLRAGSRVARREPAETASRRSRRLRRFAHVRALCGDNNHHRRCTRCRKTTRHATAAVERSPSHPVPRRRPRRPPDARPQVAAPPQASPQNCRRSSARPVARHPPLANDVDVARAVSVGIITASAGSPSGRSRGRRRPRRRRRFDPQPRRRDAVRRPGQPSHDNERHTVIAASTSSLFALAVVLHHTVRGPV